MRWTLSIVSLAFVTGCAWPPTLPSTPSLPSPAGAANQATSAVDQATGTVSQTTGTVTRAVPRLQAPPMMSAPQLGGGGLLRR